MEMELQQRANRLRATICGLQGGRSMRVKPENEMSPAGLEHVHAIIRVVLAHGVG